MRGGGGRLVSRVALVVDDEEDNRRIIRDVLASVGWTTVEATTGGDGVEQAGRHRPDIVLMDIQLPDISGYDATRRLKADPALRDIPVVAVTASALQADEEKARAAG